MVEVGDGLTGRNVCFCVTAAMEAAGAELLYLPPYSPDLNPIEMTFAQLKSTARRRNRRTVD